MKNLRLLDKSRLVPTILWQKFAIEFVESLISLAKQNSPTKANSQQSKFNYLYQPEYFT